MLEKIKLKMKTKKERKRTVVEDNVFFFLIRIMKKQYRCSMARNWHTNNIVLV